MNTNTLVIVLLFAVFLGGCTGSRNRLEGKVQRTETKSGNMYIYLPNNSVAIGKSSLFVNSMDFLPQNSPNSAVQTGGFLYAYNKARERYEGEYIVVTGKVLKTDSGTRYIEIRDLNQITIK